MKNNQKHWCLLSMKCNSVYTTYTLCYTANTWVYTIYTSVYIEYTSIIHSSLKSSVPRLICLWGCSSYPTQAVASTPYSLNFDCSAFACNKFFLPIPCLFFIRIRGSEMEIPKGGDHRFRVKVVKFDDLLYPNRFVAQICSKVGWGKKMRNQQLFLANKRKRNLTLIFFDIFG